MSSFFKLLTAFSFSLLWAAATHAQPYVGFSYMSLGYEEKDVEVARLPAGTTFEFDTVDSPNTGIPTDFEEIYDLDERLEGVSLKYGYILNRFLAVETRAGLGVSKITLDDFAERLKPETFPPPTPADPPVLRQESIPRDAELTMKYYYGVYFRLGMMHDWQVSPYVLFGLSRGFFHAPETDVNGKAGDHLEDESLGAGFNVKLNDVLNVNVEYIELFDSGDIEISNWNIGLEYHM